MNDLHFDEKVSLLQKKVLGWKRSRGFSVSDERCQYNCDVNLISSLTLQLSRKIFWHYCFYYLRIPIYGKWISRALTRHAQRKRITDYFFKTAAEHEKTPKIFFLIKNFLHLNGNSRKGACTKIYLLMEPFNKRPIFTNENCRTYTLYLQQKLYSKNVLTS